MKTKQYLAMAFAATALFACSNDDAPKPEEMGEAGKAWASFSISIPKSSMTRAADAANATAAEMEIKTVTLYQEGEGSLGGALKVADFVVGDFTEGTGAGVNTYVATKAVPVRGTAGGTCNVFAVINQGAKINAQHILAAPTANSVLTIASVDDLKATATGFVMSSKAAVEADMYGTAADALAGTHAKIEVDRAVSKVLVKTATTGLDLTGDVADKGTTGKFTGPSVKWLVGNSNRKFNVIPNTDGGKDPNWPALATGSTFTNLAAEYFQLTPAGSPLVNPTYTMAVAANSATATTTTAIQYCVENNNDVYQVGNTSYVSIIAEFTPNLIVVVTDINDATNAVGTPATTGSAQTTFYYHVAKQLYFNKDAYDKYVATATTTSAAAGAAAVKEFYGPYTDGKCYYHVPIGEGINDLQTATLGVKRNHLYTMTIKSLTAPGNPLPTTPDPTDPGVDPSEPTDPTTPIVPSNAWIAVDLDVVAWNGIEMGEVDLQ